MVPRCVALLALAAASQAVNLEHKPAQSAFGQTVLAQLQTKIAQGSPASELNSIIAEIRERLNGAQTSDNEQSAQYRAQCVTEDNNLATDIVNKKADIASKENEISDKEDEIRTLTDQIAAYADKIIRDQKVIDDVNAEMSRNVDEWRLDQEVFANRTADTNTCIEAITEIRALDLGTLKAGQDDNAEVYNDGTMYKDDIKLGLLEKLSKKVRDPTVLAFIQTTQVAMSQMTKGQIDDLVKLLDTLEADLKGYLQELKDDNVKNEEAFEAKKAALGAELVDAENTLNVDITTKAAKEAEKGQAQADLKVLDAELVDEKALLVGLENEKIATAQKCADLEAAKAARSSERKEELDTLAEIEQIIADKLGGMQSHITDKISVGQ